MPKKLKSQESPSLTQRLSEFVSHKLFEQDWRKYVLFSLFFVLSSVFSYSVMNYLAYNYAEYFCGPIGLGFPLPYQAMDYVPCVGGELPLIQDMPTAFERLMYFVFDVVFWYVTAAVILWLYDGIRKR